LGFHEASSLINQESNDASDESVGIWLVEISLAKRYCGYEGKCMQLLFTLQFRCILLQYGKQN